MPSDDHTPVGHAGRYIDASYDGMRDDHARTEAYRRAIAAAAPGQIVLDIGTGALALLALFAAESGAEHVYAFEVNETAYIKACATVAASAFADRITVVKGFSTDPDVVLPRKCTLIIHELIGEFAGEEGVVAAVLDAAHRHIDPQASAPLSVPSRTLSLVAPAELPDATSHPQYCANLLDGLLDGPGQAGALKLPALPRDALLAAAQPFEDLRFETASPAASQRCDLLFVAERAGTLRGLTVHVDLICTAAPAAATGLPTPEVSSAWAGSHWYTVFLLLDASTPLVAGQRVRVLATCELAGPQPRYAFEVWREEAGGGAWQALTDSPICYPEAALNVNDAMDVWMQSMEG